MIERLRTVPCAAPADAAAPRGEAADAGSLESYARSAGFVRVACPSCKGRDPACGNCAGSGQLWSTGAGELDDRGLERHRELARAAKR